MMTVVKTDTAAPFPQLIRDLVEALDHATRVKVRDFEFIALETPGGRILYDAVVELGVVRKLVGDGQYFSIQLAEFPLTDWLAALQVARQAVS